MKMNEWCTDCKEYDKEKHCCPRFNQVIRHTMNDSINAVLDKIAAEIEAKRESRSWRDSDYYEGWCDALNWVCDNVLNKYKAESEG